MKLSNWADEHQVDEGEREQERDVQAGRGFLELARLAGEIGLRRRGQHPGGGSLQISERVAERVARRDGRSQRGRAQLVEVIELLGRDALRDRDDVVHRDHQAVVVAHVDRRQIVRIAPVDVRDLHDHVVLLAAALEAGHLTAAEHGLERAPHGVDLEADVGDLLAVEVDLELRLVELEIGVEVDHAGIVARLGQQRIDQLLQLLVRLRGLDHELHRLLDRALARARAD